MDKDKFEYEKTKPSDFGRLVQERDALPANDPRRKFYDDRINKETTVTSPYSMPMPVLLPNGQPGFAPKGAVAQNPEAFKPIPPDGQGSFKREDTLRDEFNTLTKDFRTVQDAYSKIKQTSDSGAGDMSMLYAYVKLLDPGSVVRESEFATAAAAGSFGERVQGAVKSITSGGKLPPSLRKEFLGEAENIYNGQKLGYDRTKENYKKLSNDYGLNSSNIISDYAEPTTNVPTSGQSITPYTDYFK